MSTVLLVAGCGVPMQDSALPVAGASPPTASVAPTTAPAARDVPLWFVSEGRLVHRLEPMADPVTASALLDRLAAVPSAADPTLRSLVADPTVGGSFVQAAPGQPALSTRAEQTVQVSPTFASMPATDQVLLLGQVVLTLTGAGASAVLVTDSQGSPLSIPLPDGRLLEGPATRVDYLPLIHLPAPAPTGRPSG